MVKNGYPDNTDGRDWMSNNMMVNINTQAQTGADFIPTTKKFFEKCIIKDCENEGKIWVNRSGPYCYTHHHQRVLKQRELKETEVFDCEAPPIKNNILPSSAEA